MLEGYSRSWGIRINPCHNQTGDGIGEASLTEGKVIFEPKVAIRISVRNIQQVIGDISPEIRREM